MNIEKTIKNYEELGYVVHYFETKQEASDYLNEELKGTTIGIGGSMTIDAMGLYESLSQNNEVYWHWKNKADITSAASTAVYLTSANGMSEEGEIVNIDGTGNRISSMLFGHEHLIIIAGVNKVCPTLDDAIYRAKNIASPLNARRFNADTPCVKSKEMKCYNCKSKARICHGTVILARPMNSCKKTEVIFINENLGY